MLIDEIIEQKKNFLGDWTLKTLNKKPKTMFYKFCNKIINVKPPWKKLFNWVRRG